MNRPLQCEQQNALVSAVKAGGLEEVRIVQNEDGTFSIGVKIKTKRERLYLASRRNDNEPRKVKKADTALAIAAELFGVKKFTVSIK